MPRLAIIPSQTIWSLNLKIYVIVSGAVTLFTLNISINSTWIFSLNSDWLISFKTFPKRRAFIVINKSQSTFMKLVYLINSSTDTSRWVDSTWIATSPLPTCTVKPKNFWPPAENSSEMCDPWKLHFISLVLPTAQYYAKLVSKRGLTRLLPLSSFYTT